MNGQRQLIEAHFDELDHQLRHLGAGPGLSETHGMACGLICSGQPTPQSATWPLLMGEAAEHPNLKRVLNSVFSFALQSLGSEDFDFTLLLPSDDVPMSIRTDALADWCSGFSQALLVTHAKLPKGQTTEALEDIMALSKIEPDDTDVETQRRNLTEIEEYLRAAVQVIFDELNPGTPDITPTDLH